MVSVATSDVADALHESGAGDLPDGYDSDITAAETLVETQVEPYTETDQQELVNQCAVYVAAAFIIGTEGETVVSEVQRDSQTIRFDTATASNEAQDYWTRAKAFDPTGRLGEDTDDESGFFTAH